MKNTIINKKSFIFVFLKLLSFLYIIPLYLIIGSIGGALYGYAYSLILVLTVFSTTAFTITAFASEGLTEREIE